MKKLFFVLCSSLTILTVSAQSFRSANTDTPNQTTNLAIQKQNVFLGIGGGLNSYSGLIGGAAAIRAYENLFIKTGVGLGTWGYKATIGLKLDFDSTGSWSVGVGYAISPGSVGLKSNLEVMGGQKKEVTFDTKNASSVNFSITKNWYMGSNDKNCLFLDLGYGLAMETEPWTVTDGSHLTDLSKSALRIIQPGGLIIATGFMFGL